MLLPCEKVDVDQKRNIFRVRKEKREKIGIKKEFPHSMREDFKEEPSIAVSGKKMQKFLLCKKRGGIHSFSQGEGIGEEEEEVIFVVVGEQGNRNFH